MELDGCTMSDLGRELGAKDSSQDPMWRSLSISVDSHETDLVSMQG